MSGPSAKSRPLFSYLLVLSASAGFSMMVVEVSAPRLMAPFFGASSYLWTNVIGVILAALAAGYYLGGKIADRFPRLDVLVLIAFTGGLLAACVPELARGLSAVALPSTGTDALAVPVYLRASLLVTLIVFAPPVFVMGTLSPLVVRLLAERAGVGQASGAASASGTLGALAGTFGTTLWLIPALGSRKTVLTAAALLSFVAAAGLFHRSRRLGAPAVVAVLLLFGWLLTAEEGPIRDVSGLLEEVETDYQYARVQQFEKTRLLVTDSPGGVAQSVSVEGRHLTGGLYFDHALGLPFLGRVAPRRGLKTLVLGFGAGTIGMQYRHFFGGRLPLFIEGVEIDPALVDLGRRYFGLETGTASGVEVHLGDARTFISHTPSKYDVIYLDVFAHAVEIPPHLATIEFFRRIRHHLRPGGVLGMNLVTATPESELAGSVLATARAAFGEVWYYRIGGSANFLIIATESGKLDLPSARRRAMAYLTGPGAPEEGRELAHILLEGWDHVTRVTRSTGALLTDDRSPTTMLAVRDARRAWR